MRGINLQISQPIYQKGSKGQCVIQRRGIHEMAILIPVAVGYFDLPAFYFNNRKNRFPRVRNDKIRFVKLARPTSSTLVVLVVMNPQRKELITKGKRISVVSYICPKSSKNILCQRLPPIPFWSNQILMNNWFDFFIAVGFYFKEKEVWIGTIFFK